MRLRLEIALIAVVLLSATGQCLIACATEACGGAVPACHKHHAPKKADCSHPLLVAVSRPQIAAARVTPVVADSTFATPVTYIIPAHATLSPVARGTSPPSNLPASRPILRV